MSVIDEIKQKIDIVEVIGQYTKLSRSGKGLKGLCPFHSEKHGSFFVYPDQQTWHCFGACGTGGDVFSFIMKKEGCDFTEAKKMLAERAGVTLAPEGYGEKERKEKNDRLYRINEAAAEYYHQLLLTSPEAEKTRQYLLKRGLNAASVENFKLGYAPMSRDALMQHLLERGFSVEEMVSAALVIEPENRSRHDLFHHRLHFPIADARDRVTGFGGRALDEAIPKYLNTLQTDVFDKKATLYALNRARDEARKQDRMVIVEATWTSSWPTSTASPMWWPLWARPYRKSTPRHLKKSPKTWCWRWMPTPPARRPWRARRRWRTCWAVSSG
jgi:DNA primase